MRGLLVAVVLVVAGCSGGGTTTTSSSDPRALVLTPGDLARGYEYGDDTVCGRADASEGNLKTLQALFAEEAPNTCIMELQWVWKGVAPYSRAVTSAAYVFRNAHDAGRVFADRDDLAVYTATLRVRERQRVELGDEAEFLRGAGLNYPAAGVVWRAGNLLGVVVAEPARNEVALELAKRQQARIEHPIPPSRTQLANDPALQLDDSTLTLPVYWLGRTFDPAGALPPLKLERASVGGAGPGQAVQLWYEVRGKPETVSLDTYTPATWSRLTRTRLGRLIWDSPCAQAKVVRVRGGRAIIYHGYGAPKPLERPCPRRPPDRVVTHVRYTRVIVAVDMPYCYACAAPTRGPRPYDTLDGAEAIVRALRVRTPPR